MRGHPGPPWHNSHEISLTPYGIGLYSLFVDVTFTLVRPEPTTLVRLGDAVDVGSRKVRAIERATVIRLFRWAGTSF